MFAKLKSADLPLVKLPYTLSLLFSIGFVCWTTLVVCPWNGGPGVMGVDKEARGDVCSAAGCVW